MSEALAHQKARRPTEAERSYLAALELQPDHPDALHMLGVICHERGDHQRAKAYVLRALEVTDWKIWTYRHNLALILADEYPPQVWDTVVDRARRYRARRTLRNEAAGAATPLVSVVIASYGHARYIEQALRSVYQQSYRNMEIIVVDDGSGDGSPGVIDRCLADSPFPHRFVSRQHRGAVATLNEAAGLASGEFVGFLNADDFLHPERVARMIEAVDGVGAQWGFSAVRCIDADGEEIDPLRHRYVYDLYCAIAESPAQQTLGIAMLSQHIAASSGNLFVSRELFAAIGGFRDYRYTYAWDFCLRALRLAEPVMVPKPLYNYRLHEGNDASAVAAPAAAEARTICGGYLEWACGPAVGAGEFAPCLRNFGPVFVKIVFESGLAELVDVATLRGLAQAQP
ncbi:MAG TPA: glycosyltransferase [Casimicrobiaceae bacterium]|nr:glycosyltransferase [Casimicrobiaceae bacterium]